MKYFDEIMPLNCSGSDVAGYISALNEDFYIHLSIQETKPTRTICLRGCQKLQNVLEPVLSALEQHLHQSKTVTDMLHEIKNMLILQLRSAGLNQNVDLHMDYNLLLQQLQTCGWDKVHYVSPDFQCIHLKAMDEFEREHILKLWIPDKFPCESPRYECDLPEEFEYKWLAVDSLSNVYDAFLEHLVKFADFWNNMDEIDAKTWVLEPEKPKRRDCRRRIALASGLSLLFYVDPMMPSAIPVCHYLGPGRVVEPVREKFNKNVRLWSEYESLLSNLQQVLEREFPSPESTKKEELLLECGICYSYHLEEAIPTLNCDNPSCCQMFHHACLYEYIRLLPNMRTSFNKLFGECPYCSTPLWCTIP